jgi:hypothetical protein
VAGVTAVAVFAIAGAFAWRAFRGGEREEDQGPNADVVDLGADGSTLWPQRTHVELVSAQSRTDAGNAGFEWQLDPVGVVERFGETVIGWPVDSFRIRLDLSRELEGRIVARLERTELTCSQTLPEDEDRGIGPCLPGVEEVTLVQPLRVGDDGVWVVAAVRSPDIEIDLVSGEIVHNGASLTASVETIERLHAARTVVVGGFDEHRNCFDLAGEDPVAGGPRVEVRIRPDTVAGTECGPLVHGYVVVSTATWNVVGPDHVADPMNGDSSPYVSVEAIPFALSIPENAPARGMNVYEDPLGGWKVDLPEPWYVAPANDVAGERTLTISNVALPVEADTPVGPDASTFQPDAVVFEISKLVSRPDPALAHDDSAFPLDPDRFHNAFQTEPAPIVEFQGNGQAFRARLFVGTDAPDDDLAAMLAVVRSLRFPALALGETAHGWLSLGRPGGRPELGRPAFVNPWGVIYVVRGTTGVYVLDLEPEFCGEGGNQGWDRSNQQIVIGCPDGGDPRYERDGTPLPGNPPAFGAPLEIRPAITAWDETVLVSVMTTIDDVDRYWPHA